MKELLQRALAFTVFAFYALSLVPAREIMFTYQSGQKILDGYLERAQMQGDSEKFQKIAEQGIGAAIAEWEQESLELKFADYDEWLLQRQALYSALEACKEESFEQWRQKTLEQEKAQIQKSALYEELRAAAISFAYKKADSSETRIVERQFIDDAKSQWMQIADAIVEKHFAEWCARNKDSFALKDFVLSEYIAMENAQTNSLVNALLYDHDSLKKMTDEQAALVIAQQLADDIDSETSRSMTALFDSMQSELQSVDVETASAADQQEWLLRFQKELEAGLAKWDEAERSFLAARVEWEQNAENIFLNDNQKWMEAYNELESRKSQWSQKLEEQIEEGKEIWTQKLADLGNETKQYFDQLHEKLCAEAQQKKELVEISIETYSQCREILVMAQNGISNWCARWCEKYNGIYSYWKTEDAEPHSIDTDNLKNEIPEWKKLFIQTAKDLVEKYFAEVKKHAPKNFVFDTNRRYDKNYIEVEAPRLKREQEEWNKKYEELQELKNFLEPYSENSSAEEIKALSEKIAALKEDLEIQLPTLAEEIPWETIDEAEKIWCAEGELYEWISLYEKYHEESERAFLQIYSLCGSGIEDSGYDEIQNELSKLRALEEYWQNQESVARAVYEYSQNTSSSQEAAAITEKNFQDAKASYSALKDEYNKKLDSLSSLQTEVDNAKTEYKNAEAAAQKALENIEAQRVLYEELCERWRILNDESAFKEVNMIGTKMRALEIDDEKFEEILLSLYFSIQNTEYQALPEKAAQIKERYENGIKAVSVEEMLPDYSALEDFEGIESDALQGEIPKVFSNSELQELKNSLENFCGAQSLELSLIKKMLSELKEFDFSNGVLLEEKIAEYEQALAFFDEEAETQNTAETEIKNTAAQILDSVKDEILRRNAIFTILDENIEEIDRLLSENPEFKELAQQLEQYSPALIKRKQDKARAEVWKTISAQNEKNAKEFTDALSNLSELFDQAGKKILELYIKALNDSQQVDAEEEPINETLKNIFVDKEISVPEEHNFHLAVFENFFARSEIVQNNGGTPCDYSLLDTAEEYAKYIALIRNICADSKDKELGLQELTKDIENQQTEITNAQEAYREKVEELRGDSPQSALNVYMAAAEKYNAAISECHSFYDKLEQARTESRAAEEIYFYAQNTYLHGNIEDELLQNLEYANKKLLGVNVAIEVLLELQSGEQSGGAELDDFKKTAKQYYTARVLAYEYNRELAEQEERLRQAQLEERSAMQKLVVDFQDDSIPVMVRDLISVAKYGDEFSFSLDTSQSDAAKAQNEILLKEYYSQKSVSIDENEKNNITQAKKDALDFLVSLEGKDYSIEDLALAVLYLKLQSQNKGYLLPEEDPNNNEYYPLDNIPEKLHSVNIWDAYKGGRLKAIEKAYDKVIKSGGQRDIVNYILYSQTNIAPNLDLSSRAHDTLSVRGMENVISKIDERAAILEITGSLQLVLVMTLTVINCIPIFGSWAAVPLVAATAVYISLMGAAEKLRDAQADIVEIQSGYEQTVTTRQNTQQEYISMWKAAAEHRKKEEERLNVLLYGSNEKKESPVTWNEFKTSLEEFCGANNSVPFSAYEGLHSESTNNLEQLFNEAQKGNCYSNSEVISRIMGILSDEIKEKEIALKNYEDAQRLKKENATEEFYSLLESPENADIKTALKNAAQDAWGKNSFNSKKFNSDLAVFYGKEILPALPQHFGLSTEDYFFDVFYKMQSLYTSQMLDENSAQEKAKQSKIELLMRDMSEQFTVWENRMNAAIQIGIFEWQAADEKINAAYNQWQKNWLYEYEQKNDEWDSNYNDFLNEKQDWINTSYLQAGVSEPTVKNYAAVSQIKRSTEMGGDISEYVSSLYDHEKFSALSALAQNALSIAKEQDFSLGILAFDKTDSAAFKNLAEAYSKQKTIEDEMKKAAAKYQAQTLQEQLQEDINEYFAVIEERNKGVDDWEIDLVKKAGYTVDSEIHRNAIVDSLAFETIRENQTVHRYEYFATKAPDIAFDTSAANDFLIMQKSQEMQSKIYRWQQDIFGDEAGNGKLQAHIGTSGALKEEGLDLKKSLEANILDPGSGEMGKITLEFQWNAIKNSQGYAELSRAIYDQKLTSEDSWFHIPTIREIVGIVCDILGNIVGPWAKYIDDTVFGILDVGMGYKSLAEVANEAIKQGLISAVSYGASAAGTAVFSQIGTAIGANVAQGIGKGAQILAAAQNATVGLTTKVASSYINAFDFVRGTMDWNAANSVWTSASTWTSMAGTMLGGALGELNNVDAIGNKLSGNVFGNIEKMNQTIGSLSGEALNYLLTGDFSLNLASVNGVGLFEVGIKGGKFSAGISEGGTSFSLLDANISAAGLSLNDNVFQTLAKGAKDAKKVAELKKGSLEDQIVRLNAANLLGYSGTQSNAELARRLFDSEQEFAFMELAGEKELSARQGEKIILDSTLLSQDKDSQAAVASLLAYQNAFVSDTSLDLSKFDFSKLKKDDDTAYTKEEIEAEKKKIGSDNTLSAMIDSAAAFAIAHDILGSDYDSVANMENLSTIAEAYKAGGAAGVFAIYAQINAMQKKAEEKAVVGDKGSGVNETPSAEKTSAENAATEVQGMRLTFENVMRLSWYQNDEGNNNYLLGTNMTDEQYDQKLKETAADKYVSAEMQNIDLTGKTPQQIEALKNKLKNEALADETILKQNGYNKEAHKEYRLGDYGCTLSTVAYIVYSITGNIYSLKEANEFLKQRGIFQGDADENGIVEKGDLNAADSSYLRAVNALAGKDVLQTDGENFSESDSSKIFQRLIASGKNTDDLYYVHMRVLNTHSVLFNSMTYTDEKDFTTATVNVYNPWKSNGTLGSTAYNFSQINRADFYKLTQAGKDIYNLRRAFDEAVTSAKSNAYINLRKAS